MLVATPVLLPLSSDVAEARKSKGKPKPQRAAKAVKLKRSSPAPVTVATAMPAVGAALAAGDAAAPAAEPYVPPKLTISTDKPSYKAGDLITIGVVADGRCDLTLVGIDSEDFATVLYPNDFDYNNQLNGGELMSFPALNAPYQLRVKLAGTETLLGICSEPGHRPLGISADYDRNRFTQIGDWTEFLANKDAREKTIQQDSKVAISLAKRKRRKLPEPPLPVGNTASEGRSIVLVPVE
jgi:hypothetical protein